MSSDIILNHIGCIIKLSLHPHIRGNGSENKVKTADCVGAYNGTDKERETKPDVVFQGVSSESQLGYFLVAELSCLSKASWELSSEVSWSHHIREGEKKLPKNLPKNFIVFSSGTEIFCNKSFIFLQN